MKKNALSVGVIRTIGFKKCKSKDVSSLSENEFEKIKTVTALLH